MNHKELNALIDSQQRGWSLERAFYTEPAIFEMEWDAIWSQYWLFAGTTAEIPRPGDYLVYNAGKDSVIIIRGNKGEIYAHHNTCRHRGSLICLEESGNAPKLMCPYHQWVYNRDGSLFRARLMPEDFDKSEYGLHPAHIAVISGLIFISLAQDPPDFEQVRRDYTPFIAPFQVEEAKLAYKTRYTLRTNWKLVAENFRECYHCGPAHPEYCGAVIGANLVESALEVTEERRKAWEAQGLETQNVDFAGDSFHFAVRYPLRPGFQSYGLDGKPVSIPMGTHPNYDAGVLGLVVLPGFWMDAVADYMWFMRVTPQGPDKTVIDLSWLVDGKAVEGVDYTLEKLTEFWKITGEQDWQLCENNFKGVESSRYRPGPYAPDESEVARFIDWYLDRMRQSMPAWA